MIFHTPVVLIPKSAVNLTSHDRQIPVPLVHQVLILFISTKKTFMNGSVQISSVLLINSFPSLAEQNSWSITIEKRLSSIAVIFSSFNSAMIFVIEQSMKRKINWQTTINYSPISTIIPIGMSKFAMEHWRIISMNYFVWYLEMIFRVIWAIFLPMLIAMIIIGVDITLREHFSNEWIELLNRIYGEHARNSIEFFQCEKVLFF